MGTPCMDVCIRVQSSKSSAGMIDRWPKDQTLAWAHGCMRPGRAYFFHVLWSRAAMCYGAKARCLISQFKSQGWMSRTELKPFTLMLRTSSFHQTSSRTSTRKPKCEREYEPMHDDNCAHSETSPSLHGNEDSFHRRININLGRLSKTFRASGPRPNNRRTKRRKRQPPQRKKTDGVKKTQSAAHQ